MKNAIIAMCLLAIAHTTSAATYTVNTAMTGIELQLVDATTLAPLNSPVTFLQGVTTPGPAGFHSHHHSWQTDRGGLPPIDYTFDFSLFASKYPAQIEFGDTAISVSPDYTDPNRYSTTWWNDFSFGSATAIVPTGAALRITGNLRSDGVYQHDCLGVFCTQVVSKAYINDAVLDLSRTSSQSDVRGSVLSFGGSVAVNLLYKNLGTTEMQVPISYGTHSTLFQIYSAPVPEPSSFAMAGTAGFLVASRLLFVRRRASASSARAVAA